MGKERERTRDGERNKRGKEGGKKEGLEWWLESRA